MDTARMIPDIAPNRNMAGWLGIITGILAIKTAFYIADPSAMFFLGDSMSYIQTAVTGWVPPDRSYYYGLFIGAVTWITGSLNSLVIAQLALSAASCLMVAVILVRFFGASLAIAALAALLCALEPIQLLYERYVMTETLSLFLFALFLFFILSTLRSRAWSSLVMAILSGFAMIEIRAAFGPVYGFALCVAAANQSFPHFRNLAVRSVGEPKGSAFIRGAAPWVLIVAAVAILNSSAKTLQQSGFFLLSAWSPALENNTIPFGPDLKELTRDMPCDLGNLYQRNGQRWSKDCLIDRIRNAYGNDSEANRYSRDAARFLLLHDPLGVAGIGAQTYLQFWDSETLDHAAIRHRGTARPLPEGFRESLADHYDLRVPEYQQNQGITGRYFQAAKPWYKFIMAFPLVLLVMVLAFRRGRLLTLFLGCLYCGQLAVVAIFASIISIRYLHPLAWLAILLSGVCLAQIRQYRRSPAQPGE